MLKAISFSSGSSRYSQSTKNTRGCKTPSKGSPGWIINQSSRWYCTATATEVKPTATQLKKEINRLEEAVSALGENVAKAEKIEKKKGVMASGEMAKVAATILSNSKNKEPAHNEIQDSEIIFNNVLKKLETKYGRENLRFPREIIWLMGAPGAGKSYNAPWILKARGITAEEIVISSLLTSPEAQQIKKEAGLVGDSLVVEILLEQLLQPKYANGVLVDGFPRTKVQVECIKMFKDLQLQLHAQYRDTPIGMYFRRPVFRVAVLFVDEKESVARQLQRGKEVKEHNEKVREGLLGEPKEERPTDYSETLARKRYGVFKDHYSTLQELGKFFTFSVINTKASVNKVREDIAKEFAYQSSLELSHQTFESVSKIPLMSEITQHARQNLVRRLDHYQSDHTPKFEEVIETLKKEFLGPIKLQSISGEAEVRTTNTIFSEPLVVEMALDILAERGYRIAYHQIRNQIPLKIDLQTGYVTSYKTQTIHVFQVRFRGINIRGAPEDRESYTSV